MALSQDNKEKIRGLHNERASDFIGGLGEGYAEGAKIAGPIGGVISALAGGFENWIEQGAKRKAINENRLRNRKQMENARVRTGDVMQAMDIGRGTAGAQQFAEQLGRGTARRSGQDYERARRSASRATTEGTAAAGKALTAAAVENAKRRGQLSDKGSELYEQLKGVKTNAMAGVTGIIGDIASSPESIAAFRKSVDPNNKLWQEASGYGQGFIPASDMKYGFIPGKGLGWLTPEATGEKS